MEFGIVIAAGGAVHEFDVIQGRVTCKLRLPPLTIRNWRDRSLDWQQGAHRSAAEAGFRVFDGGER